MLSTLKSSLKVSLISLILIFSSIEVSHAHRHHSYAHDGGRQANNPGWMTSLKNDVLLSQLSIPGTHDTMSFYGGPYVQTQSMALTFQLESGIRVLDIRCRHVRDRFAIVHGSVHQNAWFNQVLDMVVDFLEKNRGETVLMRVKKEGEDQANTRSFETTFREEYWNHHIAHMWQGKDDKDVNPTLGEMRGKIVILQNFDNDRDSKERYGIPYDLFSIQDYFQLRGNADLYNKWLKVKAHLEAANKNPDEPGNRDKKYMNYLSGSGSKSTLGRPLPYFVVSGHIAPPTGADRLYTDFPAANNRYLYPNFPRLPSPPFGVKYIYYEGTNTLTYGAILNRYYTERVGIIMTDFPGGGLINLIIGLNNRFRK